MSYQQPPMQPPMQPGMPPKIPGKGQAIASLVLGICALVIPYGGIACAIVGLILGVMGKNTAKAAGYPNGMATAGIVLCIIALGFAVLMVICLAGCGLCATEGLLSGLY